MLDKSELEILLSIIEAEMKVSLFLKQEVMNRCLCKMGIRYEEYTERCIKIGGLLGVKGCKRLYLQLCTCMDKCRYCEKKKINKMG